MSSAAGGTGLRACGWASVWILLLQLGSDPGAAEKLHRVGDTVHLSGNISVAASDDVRWKVRTDDALMQLRNVDQDYHYIMYNGTLQIREGNRNHSGLYYLEIYNKTGTCLLNKTFNITFLEPISNIRVLPACSEGQNISVTCTVDSGDDVHFLWKWTFNGSEQSMKPPTEPDKHMVHIQFKGGASDRLICEAKNAVSEMRAEVQPCRGYVWKLMVGAGFLVVCLLVGFLAVRRRRSTVSKSGTENVYLDMTGRLQANPAPQHPAAPPPDSCTYEQLRPLRKKQPPSSPSPSLSPQSPSSPSLSPQSPSASSPSLSPQSPSASSPSLSPPSPQSQSPSSSSSPKSPSPSPQSPQSPSPSPQSPQSPSPSPPSPPSSSSKPVRPNIECIYVL